MNRMQFSFYKPPVDKNLTPYRDITLEQLYTYVTGHYLKAVTEEVRDIKRQDNEAYKKAKAHLLPYITTAGTFTYRKATCLKDLSGLMSFDFDHIDPISARKALVNFEGVQFMFVSPGADGLKVIVKNPRLCSHYKEDFERLKAQIKEITGLTADNTPDISRACFLCHDPEAWIRSLSPLDRMKERNPAVQMLIGRLELTTI